MVAGRDDRTGGERDRWLEQASPFTTSGDSHGLRQMRALRNDLVHRGLLVEHRSLWPLWRRAAAPGGAQRGELSPPLLSPGADHAACDGALRTRPSPRGMSTSTAETAPLGNTGLEITRVGFGAWAIGGGGWEFGWGPQDDDDSIAAIHHALGLGINWIDTAAAYGFGHSEQIVGRALADLPKAERPYV